jgi:hypothetical protein
MSDQLVAEATTYKIYIHAHSGIRTRDPSNQAVEDIPLRLYGHRDRHNFHLSRRIIPRLNYIRSACRVDVWKGLYEPIVSVQEVSKLENIRLTS